MISIIICARQSTINQSLVTNIEDTIGCEHELIVIDNSKNEYSIFEAYNLGIDKSKGGFLCFMHDDVFFITKNWGVKILRFFIKDPKIGLLGIAGAAIKSKMPSGWWDCPNEYKSIYLIQHFPDKIKEKVTLGWQSENQVKEVAVIDGVFMFARKDEKITFQKNLGFHNYDLYLSAMYNKSGYKTVVTNAILLEHFSYGKVDSIWLDATYKFFKKYHTFFPINKTGITKVDAKKLELQNGFCFIEKLIKKSDFKKVFFVWYYFIKIKLISIYNWEIVKLIVHTFFNKRHLND